MNSFWPFRGKRKEFYLKTSYQACLCQHYLLCPSKTGYSLSVSDLMPRKSQRNTLDDMMPLHYFWLRQMIMASWHWTASFIMRSGDNDCLLGCRSDIVLTTTYSEHALWMIFLLNSPLSLEIWFTVNCCLVPTIYFRVMFFSGVPLHTAAKFTKHEFILTQSSNYNNVMLCSKKRHVIWSSHFKLLSLEPCVKAWKYVLMQLEPGRKELFTPTVVFIFSCSFLELLW